MYAIVLEALDNYQQGLYRKEGLLQKIRGSKYMLNIFYGDLDHVIMNPPLYFKNTYEDFWITDSLSRDMIRDVDKSEVIGPNLIQSPVLGPIPPERLSGGVKTLILAHFDKEHIFNASSCGDNCAKWFLKMGEAEEVTINLYHLMDFGKEPFTIKICNTGQIVHSRKELDWAAGDFV